MKICPSKCLCVYFYAFHCNILMQIRVYWKRKGRMETCSKLDLRIFYQHVSFLGNVTSWIPGSGHRKVNETGPLSHVVCFLLLSPKVRREKKKHERDAMLCVFHVSLNILQATPRCFLHAAVSFGIILHQIPFQICCLFHG